MSQETNRQTMLCMCSFCDLFLPQGKRNPMNYCICWHFCLKLELLMTHKIAYRQLMKKSIHYVYFISFLDEKFGDHYI